MDFIRKIPYKKHAFFMSTVKHSMLYKVPRIQMFSRKEEICEDMVIKLRERTFLEIINILRFFIRDILALFPRRDDNEVMKFIIM